MKWAFFDLKEGEVTKKQSLIRKWTKLNGYLEVDEKDADIVFSEQALMFTPEMISLLPRSFNKKVPQNIEEYSNIWYRLPNKREVSFDELCSTFTQAINETNESVRKLGVDLLYSLNGNIYRDIQRFFSCFLSNDKDKIYSNNYNYYMEIVCVGCFGNTNAGLPIKILDYIDNNRIYNKELFIPFTQWVLDNYKIKPQIFDININIKEKEKENKKEVISDFRI